MSRIGRCTISSGLVVGRIAAISKKILEILNVMFADSLPCVGMYILSVNIYIWCKLLLGEQQLEPVKTKLKIQK